MDLVHHTKAIVRAHGEQQGQGRGGLLRCRLPQDLGGTLAWDRVGLQWD